MQLMQNALGLDAPRRHRHTFTADGTEHGTLATQFADQLVSLLVLLRFQNVSCRSVSVGFAEKTSVFGSV